MNKERAATVLEQLVGIATETSIQTYLPECSRALHRLEGQALANAKVARVGAPVTIQQYSDRSGGTIVRVAKKFIDIRNDIPERTDDNGMSESQSYRFRPGVTVSRAWLRADGCYYVGTSYVS